MFDNLIAMVDCSRNAVRKVETLKQFMGYLSKMGYTGIWLYMEDVYEIPSEPYFGYKRGRYSQAELKEIVSYAKSLGLKCVPAIQTLAHLNGITRWRRYNPSVLDTDDILLVDEPQTYDLIEKMFASLSECFDTNEINIGMDEAYRVGLGKYLDKHGYVDRSILIAKHLQKVVDIAKKYGFTSPIIWNDMFVRLANQGDYLSAQNTEVPKQIMDMIPPNLSLACWNYYSFDGEFYNNMLRMQQKFKRTLYYTAGAISWLGVTPHNKYSIKQNQVAITACMAQNVKNYVVAIWGDDGAECSLFATLPTLAYVAGTSKGIDYKKLFKQITNISFDSYLNLDTPNEVTQPAKMFSFCQPAKYMLYNDCLQGLYDSTITEGDSEKYKSIIKKLSRITTTDELSYLFKTQLALAKVLYYKYELASKTKKAYSANDFKALTKISKYDYKNALENLDEFYESLRYQWYKENKSYGFEVLDYRLGGLKQRLKNGQRILKDYLEGKIQKIEELEEEMLSVVCNEQMDGNGVDARTFKEVVSANVF